VEAKIPNTSRPVIWTHPSPIKWVMGLFPRVKREGYGADHPPPSITGAKEKVELYHRASSVSSW